MSDNDTGARIIAFPRRPRHDLDASLRAVGDAVTALARALRDLALAVRDVNR